MMNRVYTIRNDEGDRYATHTSSSGVFYTEVPIKGTTTEEAIQEAIDTAILQGALTNGWIATQCRDDVYCDVECVRRDYTVGTPEGQLLTAKLQEEFPDYVDYTRNEYNVVGEYDCYREPYENPSISWYDFNTTPSEALQLEFGTSYLNTNLRGWYGLKFDLVTHGIMLKMVFDEYDGDLPELPKGEVFFARTHFQDGTYSEWIDTYIYATPKRIRKFCEDKGLTYPLPENEHEDCAVVWCWGLVFNKDTLEYGPIKGYARYNLDKQAANLTNEE